MARIQIMMQFFTFLKERKKVWLIPFFIVLFLLSVIIILGETTALAPFIYTLF